MARYWNAAGLAATRAVEGGSGGYTTRDPNSSASGAYSFLDSTWRTYAPQAGVNVSQYPRAYLAPPDLQDKVASITPVSNWAGTWAGSRGANAANPNLTQATPLSPDQLSGVGGTGGVAPTNPLVNPYDPGSELTQGTGAPAGTAGSTATNSGALQQIGGFLGNWTVRGGVIVVGLVLIAAAAFHLAKEHA